MLSSPSTKCCFEEEIYEDLIGSPTVVHSGRVDVPESLYRGCRTSFIVPYRSARRAGTGAVGLPGGRTPTPFVRKGRALHTQPSTGSPETSGTTGTLVLVDRSDRPSFTLRFPPSSVALPGLLPDPTWTRYTRSRYNGKKRLWWRFRHRQRTSSPVSTDSKFKCYLPETETWVGPTLVLFQVFSGVWCRSGGRDGGSL